MLKCLHYLWSKPIFLFCNVCCDNSKLELLQSFLASFHLFLGLLYSFVDFPLTLQLGSRFKLFPESKLLQSLFRFTSNPHYLVCECLDKVQKLIESMVGIGNQQNGALVCPVLLVFEKKSHDLHSYKGLSCPRRSLNKSKVVSQGHFDRMALTFIKVEHCEILLNGIPVSGKHGLYVTRSLDI